MCTDSESVSVLKSKNNLILLCCQVVLYVSLIKTPEMKLCCDSFTHANHLRMPSGA